MVSLTSLPSTAGVSSSDAHRNPQAVGADLEELACHQTRENLVLGLFDAGLAVVPSWRKPDDPAGHAAVGVNALADAFGDNARDMEIGDPVLDVGLDVLRHDVVRLSPVNAFADGAPVHAQKHRARSAIPWSRVIVDEVSFRLLHRSAGRSRCLVLTHLVHHNVVADDAAGQDCAVGIQDAAALGREHLSVSGGSPGRPRPCRRCPGPGP